MQRDPCVFAAPITDVGTVRPVAFVRKELKIIFFAQTYYLPQTHFQTLWSKLKVHHDSSPESD